MIFNNKNTFQPEHLKSQDSDKAIKYLQQVASETNFLTFTKEEVNTDPDYYHEHYKRMEDLDNGVMYKIEENNQIIAIGDIVRSNRERLKHCGELSISVLKKYWGKGIANALMLKLIDWGRLNGIEKLSLAVRTDNERAIKFYKRFNFVIEATLKNSFKLDNDYYDEFVMIVMFK